MHLDVVRGIIDLSIQHDWLSAPLSHLSLSYKGLWGD